MAEPCRKHRVPGQAVTVMSCWSPYAFRFKFQFTATTDAELIATGVATEAALGPGKPGRTRRDGEGDRVMVRRGKGWTALEVSKSPERALRMVQRLGLDSKMLVAAVHYFRRESHGDREAEAIEALAIVAPSEYARLMQAGASNLLFKVVLGHITQEQYRAALAKITKRPSYLRLVVDNTVRA